MIILKNNFFIDSDGNQYILKEVKKYFSEKQNDFVNKENAIGFCVGLDRALEMYANECLKRKVQCESLHLNEVAEEIKKLKAEIEEYKIGEKNVK